jgi:hypothetical protein
MAKENPESKQADKAPRNPLIITRSELEQMTEADQQNFRRRNGTVTEDPAPAEAAK